MLVIFNLCMGVWGIFGEQVSQMNVNVNGFASLPLDPESGGEPTCEETDSRPLVLSLHISICDPKHCEQAG